MWHEISDLIDCGRKIEVDSEYPYWIKVENTPYPFDISHFARYFHEHTVKDTGLSPEVLLKIYRITCLLKGESRWERLNA